MSTLVDILPFSFSDKKKRPKFPSAFRKIRRLSLPESAEPQPALTPYTRFGRKSTASGKNTMTTTTSMTAR